MTVQLRPERRELGEIRLGSRRADIVAGPGTWLESTDDETGHHLDKEDEGLTVTLVDGVAVSVNARDECVFDGHDLIGAPFAVVCDLLGLELLTPTFLGEAIDFYESGLIELAISEDIVVQVTLSDYTIIEDV